MFNIQYDKNYNDKLINNLHKNYGFKFTQNYNPIYSKLFLFDQKKSKKLTLETNHHIVDISNQYDDNNFSIILNNKQNVNSFFKYIPIIDPAYYMLDYYNGHDLYYLPKVKNKHLANKNQIYQKIHNPDNSAYIDSFFCYLSSCLFNKKFHHGINFYGSFLSIKENFKYNIFDEEEVLNSTFFNKNIGNLFQFENSEMYDLIYDNKPLLNIDENNLDISLNIILNSDSLPNITNNLKNLSNDLSNNICDDLSDDIPTIDSDSDTSSEYSDDDDSIIINIKEFPVQIICLEQMENTLDSYMMENNISSEEWKSILLQIIMTLLCYQKKFEFTHNDLHTNNIMYNKTNKQFLYYKVENKYYKVPTFGKIYKIIDFGRSVYRFKNKLFCSDNYYDDGEATTQYNFGPFYDENKPKVLPNKNIDLARLGCSLYDHLLSEIKNEDNENNVNDIFELIEEWCTDDFGYNLLYKNKECTEDRFEGFQLYVMIAKICTKHSPKQQLRNHLFKKYKINIDKLNDNEKNELMDI
jgi:hypothetical protein